MLNGIDPRQFRRDPARVAAARAALGTDAGRHRHWRGRPARAAEALRPAARGVRRGSRARSRRLRLSSPATAACASALSDQRDALGLRTACTLTGHVTDDVVGLHHAFDLFVQSSDYEGTPNAVLEAMAHRNADRRHRRRRHRGARARRRARPHRADRASVDRLIHARRSAPWQIPPATRTMADRARVAVEGDLSFEARVRRVEASTPN